MSETTRSHARWVPALLGLLLLVIVVPRSLDDATRDASIHCTRALGHGDCTVRLGWLLRSYEWTIPVAELQGASTHCSRSGCWGSLDLLEGSEDLGRIDRDSFGEFSDEIGAFLDDPTLSELDASLGPARTSLMMLAALLVVGLGLVASFEHSELSVDHGAGVLRMRARGLLRWTDREIPLNTIARVQVERLPTGDDRDEPNAVVWVQLREGPPVRVGRTGEASAMALAGWIRDRIKVDEGV